MSKSPPPAFRLFVGNIKKKPKIFNVSESPSTCFPACFYRIEKLYRLKRQNFSKSNHH